MKKILHQLPGISIVILFFGGCWALLWLTNDFGSDDTPTPSNTTDTLWTEHLKANYYLYVYNQLKKYNPSVPDSIAEQNCDDITSTIEDEYDVSELHKANNDSLIKEVLLYYISDTTKDKSLFTVHIGKLTLNKTPK